MKITVDKANISVENGKVVIDMDSKQLENMLNRSKHFEDILNDNEVRLSTSNLVYLSTLKPKDEFKIGDEVFIVLEQSDNGSRVISKKFAYANMAFGDCSDWNKSPIRTLLNSDYYNKIVRLVGVSNIISMERDLTSLDGLDDYGTCNDKISLLTASEYAKYHKILGLKSNYPDWWWTITSASTPSNDYSRRVCYVRFYGVLSFGGCDCCSGVRPFFTLNSSILVSLNED